MEPIMLKNSRGVLRKPNGKPLDTVMGNEDPDFNDFVKKCLIIDPEKRLTPDDALKHVWEELSQRHADQDAQKHPHREVALKDAHPVGERLMSVVGIHHFFAKSRAVCSRVNLLKALGDRLTNNSKRLPI